LALQFVERVDHVMRFESAIPSPNPNLAKYTRLNEARDRFICHHEAAVR